MKLTNLLFKAYTVIDQSRVLKRAWVRQQFARAYFHYKQHLDTLPCAGLVRLRPELFCGGHIIDVGANIGYLAALFAKAVDPQLKVYAFEPDPVNFAMLCETISASGSNDKIVPIQAALGEHDGVVELWRNPASHADHRVWTPEFKAASPGITPDLVTVPLLSLDSFLAREQIRPLPCFVKIKVQGYELPVCLGLQLTLDSNPELTVALTYAPGPMRVLGFEPTELIELFESRGFAFYVIDKRGKLYHVPDPRSGLTDLGGRIYLELLLSRKPLAL